MCIGNCSYTAYTLCIIYYIILIYIGSIEVILINTLYDAHNNNNNNIYCNVLLIIHI